MQKRIRPCIFHWHLLRIVTRRAALRKLGQPPLQVRHDALRQRPVEGAVGPGGADAHAPAGDAHEGEGDGRGGDFGAEAKLRPADGSPPVVGLGGIAAAAAAAVQQPEVGHQPRELARFLRHVAHGLLPVRDVLVEQPDQVVAPPGLQLAHELQPVPCRRGPQLALELGGQVPPSSAGNLSLARTRAARAASHAWGHCVT